MARVPALRPARCDAALEMSVKLTFALFFSYALAAQADAHIGIMIDAATRIYSIKRIHHYYPALAYSSKVTSATTDAQVNHPTCEQAEQLYEAASADARTLERAIYIAAFRREVERALGKRMTDDELRALADQAREEAHRWYKYLQSDRRCSASGHGEVLRPRLMRYTLRVIGT